MDWAFGCWHGHEVAGTGRMTIMIAHPAETALQPARPDDIVRPALIP